jgi:hypothetical protein
MSGSDRVSIFILPKRLAQEYQDTLHPFIDWTRLAQDIDSFGYPCWTSEDCHQGVIRSEGLQANCVHVEASMRCVPVIINGKFLKQIKLIDVQCIPGQENNS